jgi:tetrahydromethanopterin S-methyltransferase subunit G
VNENTHATLSFDRMRSMLLRAAEIRESEQQQVFDALDEIHARLAPLESLGSVRKRLTELPDRADVSVLAERLDETLSKIETQDGAIADLGRAVEGLVDKLAKPFAQLDGRLDGVAGRFEGVAGRMDGLEDKFSHIHKRLDDLDLHMDKQDVRLEALPGAVQAPVRERIEILEAAVRGRLDEVDEGVHEHLDGTREALQRTLTETKDGLTSAVGTTRDTVHGRLNEINSTMHNKLDDLIKRPAVDPTETLQLLTQRLEQVTARLDTVSARLDEVEAGVGTHLGKLSGAVEHGLSQIDESLAERPTSETLTSVVRKANEDSERQHAGQLDEAMATFAELILGGGAMAPPPPPTTLPRPQRRSRKSAVKGRDGAAGTDLDLESSAESA